MTDFRFRHIQPHISSSPRPVSPDPDAFLVSSVSFALLP